MLELNEEMISFIKNWNFFYDNGDYSPLHFPRTIACSEEELQSKLGEDYYFCADGDGEWGCEISRYSFWG